MSVSRPVLWFCCAALMSGCVPGTGTQDFGPERGISAPKAGGTANGGRATFPAPPEAPQNMHKLIETARAGGVAEDLARECGQVDYESGRYKRMLASIVRDLVDDGASEADLMRARARFVSGNARSQDAAYIQRRGIVFGEADTYCAAARAEMSEGTDIGQFLSPG